MTPVTEHEGKKYLRTIRSAVDPTQSIEVDVYAVDVAFDVTCPGRQQAVKKLLCAGLRGKGSQLEDLIGAEAALSRAIELQRQRESEQKGASLGAHQSDTRDIPLPLPITHDEFFAAHQFEGLGNDRRCVTCGLASSEYQNMSPSDPRAVCPGKDVLQRHDS